MDWMELSEISSEKIPIFLNKTRTHIKLLYWDGDGFALFYNGLERGRYAFTALNVCSTVVYNHA